MPKNGKCQKELLLKRSILTSCREHDYVPPGGPRRPCFFLVSCTPAKDILLLPKGIPFTFFSVFSVLRT